MHGRYIVFCRKINSSDSVGSVSVPARVRQRHCSADQQHERNRVRQRQGGHPV